MSHVIVTGGASGIGQAVVQRLTGAGQRVTVLDRAAEPSWWASLDPEHRGAWHVCDVTDVAAVTSAVQTAEHPVDGLVTCAGIATRESVLDVTDEQFAHTMAVNLTGTLVPVRALARHLVDGGRPGSIVTLASTAGLGYVAGLGVAYHASKAAVVGITRSLAGDLARYGIRVNCVAPGVVRTPMTVGQRADIGEEALAARAPAGRLAEPDELASAVEWLLSPQACLTTGHVLPVEGGQVASTGAPGDGYPTPTTDPRDLDLPDWRTPARDTATSAKEAAR